MFEVSAMGIRAGGVDLREMKNSVFLFRLAETLATLSGGLAKATSLRRVNFWKGNFRKRKSRVYEPIRAWTLIIQTTWSR